MRNTFTEIVKPVLGLTTWGAKSGMGSFLTFELGEEVKENLDKNTPSIRGEYHFWIYLCDWWLQRDNTQALQDIVSSESDKADIEQKVDVLNGKKLLQIKYTEATGSTIFYFDDGILLKVTPSQNRELNPQWYMFTKTHVLSINDKEFRFDLIQVRAKKHAVSGLTPEFKQWLDKTIVENAEGIKELAKK